MVDIHCHLLPGLDDGPARFSEALAMAEAAYADGIRILYATPHHGNGVYRNPASKVRKAADDFRDELQARSLELEIIAGQEVRLSESLIAELEEGTVAPLGTGRYLLLELPGSRLPKNLEEMLYELRVRELIPVIAHPERNAVLADKPSLLEALTELGALGQVTARSLLGGFGSKAGKAAWQMVRQGYAPLVATDAHDLTRRPFELSAAYRLIQQRLGTPAGQLLQDNARRLLVDEDLVRIPIEPERKKGMSRLRRFFPSTIKRGE
ncbi:tyrosine-protein phosphatase [Gorillibacterium sp. sgz500922]|uniref:tyrosine-protein phosphatase n=1 Tax=Gorillibacterium sp. sgz500922 TaxID=3446694 RepID=UPI003F67A7F8